MNISYVFTLITCTYLSFSSIAIPYNKQAGNDDIIDLHDIFSDFFAETNVAAFGDQQTQQAQFAHAQATLDQQVQQQLTALPTGQGIKTAWHTGSLPAIQKQQIGGDQVVEEPQAKRLRTGKLFMLTFFA